MLLTTLAALAMPVYAQAPTPLPAVADAKLRAEIKRASATKIILVGDSTTAVYGGWGPGFCGHRVKGNVVCVNMGRAGRSSFSYRAEGTWDMVLAEAKAGAGVYDKTYVLIQFGHNDQPGKPGRTTDLATEFPQNLRRFVEEVRAAGAVPVLVTPLTRRGFKNGKLDDSLAPWAEAARTVAREMKVPLVDLHARSLEAVQAMGPVEAMKFAPEPPPVHVRDAAKSGTTISGNTPANVAEPVGQAKSRFDYTHLGDEGADFFSKIVAAELVKAVPELTAALVP
ncbi:rhamnogalacturonan acetylesterase [Asticcacaulis sp. YBE204]|uniref:rhamnogalacturonan acetylesterase n=1 Tax=Asticcacaulis sp. YBE204 TaxID=1282363 RepID=UPI0012DDA964|nr:rhamnogalacturonan acetylesterase [Asticcacaulis sp. YBE204]